MGQKVNPVSFRILNGQNWDSVWYDEKDYAKKLVGDIKIADYIKKNYKHCAISKVLVERPADKVNVIIKTAKPGVLIGKKGSDIEKIKGQVEKIAKAPVNIKIVEVEKPDSDAQLIAQNVARQLENRVAFRRAMKKAIASSMRYGVKGVKILCSGRLGGVEIARNEKYSEGTIPLHTIRNNVEYATEEANTTYGVIGIKVWVHKEK